MNIRRSGNKRVKGRRRRAREERKVTLLTVQHMRTAHISVVIVMPAQMTNTPNTSIREDWIDFCVHLSHVMALDLDLGNRFCSLVAGRPSTEKQTPTLALQVSS